MRFCYRQQEDQQQTSLSGKEVRNFHGGIRSRKWQSLNDKIFITASTGFLQRGIHCYCSWFLTVPHPHSENMSWSYLLLSSLPPFLWGKSHPFYRWGSEAEITTCSRPTADSKDKRGLPVQPFTSRLTWTVNEMICINVISVSRFNEASWFGFPSHCLPSVIT